MKPSTLIFSSASEAAQAIREHKITSLELTEHILRRIELHNPRLNAIVTIAHEEAIERARAADDALRRGELWGALHGVPITIKDCFEISGVRTTAGATSLKDHVPENDAVAVARLRAAGAVILGHTNVPFMAGDWQSYNDVFGTTNNPWDLERTPGGSTGGGAAALAAGLSYLSLGSDVGGSIRIPAHFCGVYGHKPTVNVVPFRGHIPKSLYSRQMLWVAGPLARSAEDLKKAMEVLGGHEAEGKASEWSLPQPRRKNLSGYRLRYVFDHPVCPVSSEVKEVITGAVEALRGRVDVLEEGWPPGVDPEEQYNAYRILISPLLMATVEDDEYDKRKQALKQDEEFKAANEARTAACNVWNEYFETWDAFLLPTCFVPAVPHVHSVPFQERVLSTPEGDRPYMDMSFWISFASFAGLPATIAPVGLTKGGLPVGIQIVGPHMEDATPIDLAAKISKIVGGFRPPSGYSAN